MLVRVAAGILRDNPLSIAPIGSGHPDRLVQSTAAEVCSHCQIGFGSYTYASHYLFTAFDDYAPSL